MKGQHSIHVLQQLKARVEQQTSGVPFRAADLPRYASRKTTRIHFQFLVREGLLRELVPGLYLRPLTNSWVGEVMPHPAQVAQAMIGPAEVLQISGAEACCQLGLSTQWPTQPLYLTSASSRHFRYGHLTITLQQVPREHLLLAGSAAGLALTALHALGPGETTPDTIAIITQRIGTTPFQQLLEHEHHLPPWIQEHLIPFRSP